MSTAEALHPAARLEAPASVAPPWVEVVVPVHNEARTLGASITRLQGYLAGTFPFTTRITIADNGSTDGTWDTALELMRRLDSVRAVRLEGKGRGRALNAVWSSSDARVLAYMDVDLSTDLSALLPLVAPLVSGHSDLAIGTRLSRSARVVRGPKRELISRTYNMILHLVLRTRFSDAQCGFKAIRNDRARQLLPLVSDRAWFFDTELLVLAERAGLRIHEVPVDWTDDPDSRVDIVSTALADLRGVARLARDLGSGRIPLSRVTPAATGPVGFAGQVTRFATIGVLSTLAYAVLYLALRQAASGQAANALALLLTAIANTAANRRFTFAIRTRLGRLRHQAQGLAVFGLALAVTAPALGLLELADARASRPAELTVLVTANLVATVLRFVLLRSWVFRARRAAPAEARP
jgi:putative flippase GtrA